MNPVPAPPPERIRILTVATPPAPAAATDELFPPTVQAATKKAEAPTGAAADAATGAAAEAPTRPADQAPTMEASPAPSPLIAPVPAASSSPPLVRRVLFSFTGDESLLRDFERAKELSRHKWPAGTQEDVFAGALKVLLEKIDPDRRRRRRERARRLAAGARSRKISQGVKDEVWSRDGGRCVYVSPDGRSCGARAGLEFDHARPWSLGGSGEAGNVRLLCRTYNVLAARKTFGGAFVDAAVARRRTSRAAAAAVKKR